MRELRTPSGKPFRYRRCAEGEIIVYPSDENGIHQDSEAIVITPYTSEFISNAIRGEARILMGASRDNPPASSLGRRLRDIHQSPQQLSYLVAVLESEGFCTLERDGRAFVVVRRR